MQVVECAGSGTGTECERKQTVGLSSTIGLLSDSYALVESVKAKTFDGGDTFIL